MRSSQKLSQKLQESQTHIQKNSARQKNSIKQQQIPHINSQNEKNIKIPMNHLKKNIQNNKNNVGKIYPKQYHDQKYIQCSSQNYIDTKRVNQVQFGSQSKYTRNDDERIILRKGSPPYCLPNQHKKQKQLYLIQNTHHKLQPQQNTIKRISPLGINPVSNYLLKPQLIPKKHLSPNNLKKPSPNNYIIPLSSFQQINQLQLKNKNKQLCQVIKNLQNHNENIIGQTKNTIQNFQQYIKQLITSHSILQQKLKQNQQTIQKLQKQKLILINQNKQQQIPIQKKTKQKTTSYKYKPIQQQPYPQSPPTHTNINNLTTQIQIKQKQQQITSLKQQIQKKQQHILLLQQFISQKQNIIKNMATFNNQMCQQIMHLKNQITQSHSNSKDNQSSLYQKQVNNNSLNNNKILQQQNTSLKKFNQLLRKQIQQLIKNNQNYLITIQKQSKNIQHLTSIIQKQISKFKFCKQCYARLQNSPIDIKTLKNDEIQQKYKKILNAKQQKLQKHKTLQDEAIKNTELYLQSDNIQKQLINLMGTKQCKISKNYLQYQDQILFKKIDHILQILCTKIKNYGCLQKNKNVIPNILQTLTKFNRLVMQGQIQCQNKSNKNCAIEKIGLQNKQSNHQINSNNNNIINIKTNNNTIVTIVQKNEQILKKVKQIKQKVKSHTKNIQLQNNQIQRLNTMIQNKKDNEMEQKNKKYQLNKKRIQNTQSFHQIHCTNKFNTSSKF